MPRVQLPFWNHSGYMSMVYCLGTLFDNPLNGPMFLPSETFTKAISLWLVSCIGWHVPHTCFPRCNSSSAKYLRHIHPSRSSVRLTLIIFANLFNYLAYFYYYSWVSLHFLILFIDLTILFQPTFTFIYSTFSKKISILTK